MWRSKMCLAVLFLCRVDAADEGDRCFNRGVGGTCINISRCPAAIEDIKHRRTPQICGFAGADPLVCCADSAPTTAPPRPAATTSTTRTPSTTAYVPPVYDYRDSSAPAGGACGPVPDNLTAPRTNRKAWNKCLEYQERLVYPCEKGMALAGDLTRVNHCSHNTDELIIGGVDAARGEFPHMVLLGFGDSGQTAQWLCGGTLISERFVLTAGHCTASRDGDVSYVITGATRRTDQVDSTRLYKIQRILRHPAYKPPSKYNDIALLETDREMQLGPTAVPACVDVGDGAGVRYERAVATGWGATEYRGASADNLQKVTLTKFTTPECAAKFPASRNLEQGFNETSQFCYGDKTMSKDTCQGDSGGPIQVKNQKIFCMYTIIGITSFGKACGWIGDPGIYTAVWAYSPWIESIVWP